MPQARRTHGQKANPLRNRKAMDRLNPYNKVLRGIRKEKAGKKVAVSKADRKAKNNRSRASKTALKALLAKSDSAVDAKVDIYREQIASMNIK